MKNKKQIQKYFNKKYYNKSDNYKMIISEIRKEEKMKRHKLLKAVITAILTLLGITGTVLAGSKIYNESIKKHDEIDSTTLERVQEKDEIYYTTDFTSKYMKYDEKSNTWYKIITNIKDFSIFKSKEDRLPDMSDNDFNNSCLILILMHGISLNAHENDLMITDVTSDEKSTYITLEQKENPDYINGGKLLYAIVDKSLIKENIHIEQKIPDIKPKAMVKLDELPKDYSVQDALKDNCFVVVDFKVISKNKNALDEFIKNSKNNDGANIRIYERDSEHNINYIHDFTYKKGIFYLSCVSSEDGYKDIGIYSGRFIKKSYGSYGCDYILQNYKLKNYFEGNRIVTINFD